MKSLKSNKETNTAINKLLSIKIRKRNLLKWMPPLVVVVTLPSHAEGSSRCPLNLRIEADIAKCGGNPPDGQASIQVFSESGVVQIMSITHNAPGSDTITVPNFPATATTTESVGIVWEGPSTDLTTCLPNNGITIEVSYKCEGSSESTQSFSLSEILADAIP